MTTDPNPNPGIDRAGWKRFAVTNKDRCVVCGNKAEVAVNLTAFEKSGKGGSPMLVKQAFVYCDDHGRLAFDPQGRILYSPSEQLMADVRISEVETLVTLTQRLNHLEQVMGLRGVDMIGTGSRGPI